MPKGQKTLRVGPGDRVDQRELETISGQMVSVPDPRHLVHLQLRRFAGCPICSLHLQSIVQRHDEIAAAAIREVVVFHSRAEDFLGHEAELPFAVVADPDKQLYREFGVESSPKALLNPHAWRPTLRGLSRTVRAIRRKEQRAPAIHPHGGRLGLPADFLIASDGRVLACKYGVHAYDQWSPAELLALALPVGQTPVTI